MHFLSLLIGVLLQQKFDFPLSSRFDIFLTGLFRRLSGNASKSTDILYAVILLNLSLLCLFILISYFLGSLLWGVGEFAFEIVTLLFLLGAQGYRELLQVYSESWGRGDMQAACYRSRALGAFYPPHHEVSPGVVHLAATSAYLEHHYVRFFAVLFWFFLLGPAGGVLVRVNQHLASKSYGTLSESVSALNHLLDWMPARMLALTFAITGNFVGCIRQVREKLLDPGADTAKILLAAACGALDQHAPDRLNGEGTTAVIIAGTKSMHALRGLLSRSLALWLCAFALISILIA